MAEPPSEIFRKEAWDAYYSMVEEPAPLLKDISRWTPLAFWGLVAVAIASVLALGVKREPRYHTLEGVLLSLGEDGRHAAIRLSSP
jgi:hypothetical protein